MQTEIVISGFGGQGVLFAGQLLSYAAMDQGLEVTWIPSYGPEMRGGTANCTVIISDEEIGSPLVRNPKVVIAMNRPSLDKYDPLVKAGGLLIINSSIIDKASERKDIQSVHVPANEVAEKIGDRRLTNMVIVGALVANTKILPLEALEKALKEHLPERHHKLLPLNYQALREGAKFVAEKV
jgi:2-oxoglutarate ferredoxin oxidoreductase subunit gamma